MSKIPKEYARLGAVGLTIAIYMAAAGLGGHWLDGHFRTEKPWFTIALCLLASAGVVVYLIRKFK